MGLAFKPNIDDLRESPALLVTNTLINDGFHVLAVEPNVTSHEAFEIHNMQDAVKQADIIVYLVAHNEFKDITVNKPVIDFCNVS